LQGLRFIFHNNDRSYRSEHFLLVSGHTFLYIAENSWRIKGMQPGLYYATHNTFGTKLNTLKDLLMQLIPEFNRSHGTCLCVFIHRITRLIGFHLLRKPRNEILCDLLDNDKSLCCNTTLPGIDHPALCTLRCSQFNVRILENNIRITTTKFKHGFLQ